MGSQKIGHYIHMLCTGWFILNGIIGIIKPSVLEMSQLSYPCRYLERILSSSILLERTNGPVLTWNVSYQNCHVKIELKNHGVSS